MNRKVILILSFLFLAVVSFSQIRDSSWTTEVSLQPGAFIKPKTRIQLFDSNSFIVYSTFDLVVANIKIFIDKYEVEEDKLLLKKFLNTSKSFDRNLADIQNDNLLKSRLDFRTAELIQNRGCLVYNKTSKKFETRVIVVNYIKNKKTGIRFLTQTNQQIMDIGTGAF